MRRQLHGFKMKKSGNVMDHFLKSDELCLSMKAIGEEVSQDEQLVILFESLMEEYDPIVKIIENMPRIDLFQVKETLRRDCESMNQKESNEIALTVTRDFKSKGPDLKGKRVNFPENASYAIVMGTGSKTAGTIQTTTKTRRTGFHGM
ncbi:polyprotein [Plasmopara halstedii]|uniref:Polyprotein n=1 Tax=Plasmopara halstedii TaxID=4781 RepID=A0A0P1B7P6_PLAHL|nr:polyprotein [Plasmopara halstedii]CEG49892.1 polyprotein [Plasmopara halstedii]|eukprot:XP_024586261.1 polyprotein [Plasmopara halstedii]